MIDGGPCSDCESEGRGGLPAGPCPRCLLRLGLGDDPSGGAASGVLSSLGGSIGPVPRVLLRDDPVGARLVRPGIPEMPGRPDSGRRYQLMGELARGGMGAVLQGRDVDLGRDLAIKVILEEHRDDPEVIRRFVEEAQIGGQLQHPGIVPVHELGRFPDGRLYIAMKLVRGRTLASLLEAREGPSDDRPRFLAILEHVCQTMAYAHSRGVVHRDLKPSNVMVGSFGEVHVMDWGLAKVLDRGGVADERRARRALDEADAIRTVRSGPGDGESVAGSILGTPAYMSPEQARGELDTVDERADVFGIGSMLCEILEGRPAYSGRRGIELQAMAERAELGGAMARLDASGAEPELVALTRACLAPAPKDRPRDAGAVLARLTGFLEGSERRLREAELARVRAETLAAEERKRRTLAVALAGTVLASGALGIGGWAWVGRERLRRSEVAQLEVGRALDDASIQRGRARASSGDDPTLWVRAIEAARRAEALLPADGGEPGLRERVRVLRAALERERAVAESAENDRRMVERLAAIHNDLGVHLDVRRGESECLAAFRGYGVDVDAVDPAEAGARLAASPVAAELANALDQWAFRRRMSRARDEAGARRLVALAKAADPDPWRNRLRDTLGRIPDDREGSLEELERLAATADPARLPEASVSRLAWALASLGHREKALVLLRKVQRAHPDNFWINADLGWVLMDSDRPGEAARFFAVAAGVRPRSGLAQVCLGEALREAGHPEEAVETLRALLASRPDDAHARVKLGSALLDLGRAPEAEAEFLEARRLRPGDGMIRRLIADDRADRGEWDSAVAELREPAGPAPSAAAIHEGRGLALLDSGRVDEAILAFREAIRVDPRHAPAHSQLGRALIERGDFTAALDELARPGESPSMSPHEPDPAGLILEAGRLLALDSRLAALLEGEDRPVDAEEAAAFARLCSARRRHAASSRLWSRAFDGRPGLADDPTSDALDRASRAAAMAGSGLGEDAPPGEEARSALRRRALGWLEAGLGGIAGRLRSGSPRERAASSRRLGRWRVDPALAGIRDESALAGLPGPEARALRDFWARVEALRPSSSGPGNPGAAAVPAPIL